MDTLYKDENPPKWPHNGIPFNRRFRELHAFIYALQHNFSWANNPVGWKAKYLNIHLDTRNGNYLVFCENPETKEMDLPVTPDELGLEYKPFPFVYGNMGEMKDAPKDRDILILTHGYAEKGKNCCVVARYYKDETREEFYVGNDWSIDFNSERLLGWWDLPSYNKE